MSSPPSLSAIAPIRFEVPRTGRKKYVAVYTERRGGRVRRVGFGHRDYEHYRDRVPKRLGGGKWSHKNHLDPKRRQNYRRRHGALRCRDNRRCVTIRYSPAWFSYHFLW